MQSTPIRPTSARPGPGLTSAGLLTLLLGAALNVIDFFIVNVALPAIDADLQVSSATLEMVVAGYGIAFAVLLVLGGRLGDAFGRRRMFRIGLSAFTVTSLVCGLAPDATTLVLARIAQGRKEREIDPAAAALKACRAAAEDDRQVSAVARKRLAEMEEFVGTLNRWYDQMLSVPAPKIMALIRMGAKVVNLLGLGRGKGTGI